MNMYIEHQGVKIHQWIRDCEFDVHVIFTTVELRLFVPWVIVQIFWAYQKPLKDQFHEIFHLNFSSWNTSAYTVKIGPVI